MSEPDEFIEMGREGDEDLLDDDVDFEPRPRPLLVLLRAAWWPPALGLASLLIATGTMITTVAATEVGDLVVYSHSTNQYIGSVRWTSGFRLGVAGLALLIAVIAAIRHAGDVRLAALDRVIDRDDDDDDEGEDSEESLSHGFVPNWMQVVIGAALVVSLVAVLVNGISFLDALQAHSPTDFGFNNG